jgi:uncharacterized protein YndB with AHSA1/START domain
LTAIPLPALDPSRDLQIQRHVPVSPAQLWAGWTEPDKLMQWFCPRPWQTTECRIDLQAGGEFYTLMVGPGGENHGGAGCFLAVHPQQQLVWTSALGPGFRPQVLIHGAPTFTALIHFEAQGGGTRYTARALHPTVADCAAHAALGFEPGWGAALDQLVEVARGW